MTSTTETFAFQAEIHQLMSLIIHAFYSNKEIFLRELVANASDALDKYRHWLLTHGGTGESADDLRIRIRADKEAKCLVIEDNGIGMTREELIQNLGTIAHSGTKQFIQSLTETKDSSLIGQFGVGFYSAYLVADEVRVMSRTRDDARVHVWSSAANGSFTVAEVPTAPAFLMPDKTHGTCPAHGTQILLKLKDDQLDYLTEAKLREVLVKHSGFIGFPIEIEVERSEPAERAEQTESSEPAERAEEVVEDDANAEDETEGVVEDAPAPPEASEQKADKPPPPDADKTVQVIKWEQVNSQKPIWMRAPDEVPLEDYQSFYKSISNDWDVPEAIKHFKVEGQLEFRGLLYIPRHPPYDMFGREKRDHFKLYVRRVFITDSSEEFIPEWLSFVRGLVDSNDLPLNVSREMLQQSAITKVIKKNVIKKCVEMMTDLMNDEDPAKFKNFYDNFSKNIKLGIYDEDEAIRKKLIPLLRFHSSASTEAKGDAASTEAKGDADDRVSLADYIGRMKEGQKHIYYITGESVAGVKSAPFAERLSKKGYEVLYWVDTMDEYLTQRLTEYEGKKLVNIVKEGALDDLGDDENAADAEANAEAFKPVCEKFAAVLAGKVEKVVVSARLTETPAVLVSTQYGWTANMERIMKAQALQNNTMARHMAGKKILEINPHHRMIRALRERLDDASTENIIQLIYEGSMIRSGYGLEDPGFFVGRVHRMIEISMGLADAEGDEVPDAEVAEPEADAPEPVMEALD